ncbi:MAG: LPS export ABC transporter periplasmic protein LptC [Gammaproteobacteria bacterium]|nr:MAG: LPS export ABC transporter periplasmic protein LptC [Gammaproteobacteria bacterium]
MRFLIMLTALLITFALIFETAYLFSVRNLKKECKGEREKIAKSIKLTLFEDEKLEWKFYGKVMDLSNPKKITIEDFKAEKIGTFLKISAKKAVFYTNEKKIYLYGDVNLNSFRKGKNFFVKVSKAVVDLNTKVVKGYGLFEGREGNKLLKGNGFVYTLDGKTFKIEKNVQTSIDSN